MSSKQPTSTIPEMLGDLAQIRLLNRNLKRAAFLLLAVDLSLVLVLVFERLFA